MVIGVSDYRHSKHCSLFGFRTLKSTKVHFLGFKISFFEIDTVEWLLSNDVAFDGHQIVLKHLRFPKMEVN